MKQAPDNSLFNTHTCLARQFRKTNLLSEEEIEEFCRFFRVEQIPKNDFFIEEGKRCSRIGFLNEGILCSYIFNEEGEEVVKHFIEPGQFFTDLDSYKNETAADLNIQAVVDSEILYIERKEHLRIKQEKPDWWHAMNQFSSEALSQMIRMQNFLHFGSAVDKYRYFVKHYPNRASQVPLKFISSYLGITQSSLSRIRRMK